MRDKEEEGEEVTGGKRWSKWGKPFDFFKEIVNVWHVVQVCFRNARNFDVHSGALDRSCLTPCRFSVKKKKKRQRRWWWWLMVVITQPSVCMQQVVKRLLASRLLVQTTAQPPHGNEKRKSIVCLKLRTKWMTIVCASPQGRQLFFNVGQLRL